MYAPFRGIWFLVAFAGVASTQAHAGSCQLVWKVNRSGEYSARFTVPSGVDWPQSSLPSALRETGSTSAEGMADRGATTFEGHGSRSEPEARIGSEVLEWLKSRIGSANRGCDALRVELRTEWRYRLIPSDAVHRFPQEGGAEIARLAIGRLSSLRDPESKREYFGVEIELTLSPSAKSRSEELERWLTGIVQETDLREPGVAWNDRPLEVQFPSGLRADIGVVAGSYTPAGQSSFGTGVHCALSSESALSDTLFWKRNFFGTRAIFGQFSSTVGDSSIGLSIFDFHATTGLHWRPKVHANDTYAAGIRNFVGLSVTPGIHRVFSKSSQPFEINQAFTAPSVDLGLSWGAYNRKMNVLFDLEFHYLNYLTIDSFGPIYEFGITLSMQ